MLMAMAVDNNAGTWKCSLECGIFPSSGQGRKKKKMGCRKTALIDHSWTSSHRKTAKASLASHTESLERRKLSEAVSKLELAERVSATSYAQLLRACGELKAVEEGKRVHTHIERRGMDRDLYVRYSLIRMYLKFRGGSGLGEAKRLFFGMRHRDVILWTEMIAAHARIGQCDAALHLYQRMRVEGVAANKVTFLTLLGACTTREKLSDGRLLHSRIVEQGLESDVAVVNALLKMYIACGSVEDASRIFAAMEQRDLVSWTTMIMNHGQDGSGREAVKLFRRMLVEGVKPDCIACVALVNACANGMVLEEGRWLHSCVLESGFIGDPAVGTSLVNMYGKCGSVKEAKAVFDQFSSSHSTVVFWTAMIAVYAQNGRCEALDVFRKMLLESIRPNRMTFATVINTCANFSMLQEGKVIHTVIVECGLDADAVVANSIVNMYGRCGNLVQARTTFDKMFARETSTWNSMITAYAQHGHWDEALKLFSRMKQLGEKPNNITLVGVLSSCAHAGLVEQGCENFANMREYFGVAPTLQHYGCMVDLLGRAGWLCEAEEMIKSMPFPADAAMWTALFGGYKTHGDVEGARRAAKAVIELEPDNTGMLEFLKAECYEAAALSENHENIDGKSLARPTQPEDNQQKLPETECYEGTASSEKDEKSSGNSSHSEDNNEELPETECYEVTSLCEHDKITDGESLASSCHHENLPSDTDKCLHLENPGVAADETDEESSLSTGATQQTPIYNIEEQVCWSDPSAIQKHQVLTETYRYPDVPVEELSSENDAPLEAEEKVVDLVRETQEDGAALDQDKSPRTLSNHVEESRASLEAHQTIELSATTSELRGMVGKYQILEISSRSGGSLKLEEATAGTSQHCSGCQVFSPLQVDEDFRSFIHGEARDTGGALARHLLYMTAMAVAIRGRGLWSVISSL